MKIALLQCDHIPHEIRHHLGGDYHEVFASRLEHYFDSHELDVYDVTLEERPLHLSAYDFFIVTGSTASVYDDKEWIKNLANLVVEIYKSKIKLIGICFGHQMIAHALRGKVEPSMNDWAVGIHTFHMTKHPDWLKDDQFEFNIIMSCQDQVSELPDNSVVIAESHFCPIGIFQVGDHFLGIQGHPEWTKEYSETTMNRRRDRIPEQIVENGIKSLDQDVHTDFLFNLIKDFITSDLT